MSRKKRKLKLTRALLKSLGGNEEGFGISLGLKEDSLSFEKCRGGWNIYRGPGYDPTGPVYVTTVEELFSYIYEWGSKQGRDRLRSEARDAFYKFMKYEGK